MNPCSLGDCVEVEDFGTYVVLSSNRRFGSITVDNDEFDKFIQEVKDGKYDR